MDTTYQRLDWGRSGILATIDASIRLTKAADRLGPTRIKKCHASFVAKCALLAMLDNAVNTLLAVLYGKVSERVECVVNAIDEDANVLRSSVESSQAELRDQMSRPNASGYWMCKVCLATLRTMSQRQ